MIGVPTFYQSVAGDVKQALSELREQSVDAVLLDLRSNSGGLVTELADLAGLFIDQGPVTQVRYQRGDITVRSDIDEGSHYSGPLAVLINRRSASASELLTLALQDYRRAVVIGDSQSFGKGTAGRRMNVARMLGAAGQEYGSLDITSAENLWPQRTLHSSRGRKI